MQLKNKTIFISGGAGFIGSHLVEEFIKNNKIIVYDNLSSGKRSYLNPYFNNPNFKFIKGDLLNFSLLKKFLKNCDIVFHLAANPDIAKAVKQPRIDLDQGILTTFNILNVMRINNIKKIVYTSGSGIYGDQGKEFTAENFGPLLPTSMYGASKLSSEGLISAFVHMFGLQAWIFRPANIIGARQTHGVVFAFIHKLRKDPHKLEVLGNGKQSKSYINVKDIISAIKLSLDKSNEKINLFNLSSDSFITVNQIAKIVIQKMHLKNVKISYTGGSKGWKGDVPIVRIANQKIKKLGWKPKLSSTQAVKQATEKLIKEII